MSEKITKNDEKCENNTYCEDMYKKKKYKKKKYAGMKHSPEPYELPFPIKLLNKSLFRKKK